MRPRIFIMLLFLLSITEIAAQERKLQTAKDGFEWYELRQGDLKGAEDSQGNVLIPLSRGYTFINYHPVDGQKGWFIVWKNEQSKGACDIDGKEIIPPKYKNLFYSSSNGFNSGIYPDSYPLGIMLDNNATVNNARREHIQVESKDTTEKENSEIIDQIKRANNGDIEAAFEIGSRCFYAVGDSTLQRFARAYFARVVYNPNENPQYDSIRAEAAVMLSLCYKGGIGGKEDEDFAFYYAFVGLHGKLDAFYKPVASRIVAAGFARNYNTAIEDKDFGNELLFWAQEVEKTGGFFEQKYGDHTLTAEIVEKAKANGCVASATSSFKFFLMMLRSSV